MRRAMAEAQVGDEQVGTDPTVTQLEERIAQLLGKEKSVFLPTATMANHIALQVAGHPGDELIAEETSHVVLAESGGAARYAGLMVHGLRGRDGRLDPQQVAEAVQTRRGMSANFTRPAVLSLENTHNAAGGRVWPTDQFAAVCETAHEQGLTVHLDGARLLNASVAAGVAPDTFARSVDTVTICFSKGLGCPLGAVITGSASAMDRARGLKFALGGAMRQVGIVAAAALYALDHNVDRLADDHARARNLAEALGDAGVPVRLERVDTNMVQVDVAALGLDVDQALRRLRTAGILLARTVHHGVLRAVTHLDITDTDIDTAIKTIPVALNSELALAAG
jgi:threonine aldolase